MTSKLKSSSVEKNTFLIGRYKEEERLVKCQNKGYKGEDLKQINTKVIICSNNLHKNDCPLKLEAQIGSCFPVDNATLNLPNIKQQHDRNQSIEEISGHFYQNDKVVNPSKNSVHLINESYRLKRKNMGPVNKYPGLNLKKICITDKTPSLKPRNEPVRLAPLNTNTLISISPQVDPGTDTLTLPPSVVSFAEASALAKQIGKNTELNIDETPKPSVLKLNQLDNKHLPCKKTHIKIYSQIAGAVSHTTFNIQSSSVSFLTSKSPITKQMGNYLTTNPKEQNGVETISKVENIETNQTQVQAKINSKENDLEKHLSERDVEKNSSNLDRNILNEDSLHKLGNKENVNALTSKEIISLSQDIGNIKPNSCSLIIFDLETSGLGIFNSEILQVAAICKDLNFDCYIIPTKEISPRATAVNSLSEFDGVLFYKGDPVDSFILEDALKAFIQWLKDVPPPRLLLGHNIRRFDCPHLLNSLSNHNLVKDFSELVIGYIDTLPLFKELYPGFPNYKQNTLIDLILHQRYEEHNAIDDVKALQRLVQFSSIPDLTYMKHYFTGDSVCEFLKSDIIRRKRLFMYEMMIHNGGLSKGMADKFSRNGIAYKDLIAVFTEGGRENLEIFLGENVSGKIRGTKSRKVIDGIVKFLEEKDTINC